LHAIRWGIKPEYQALPGADPAKSMNAIANSNPKVRDIASTFGIPAVYASYDELQQDPDIDAVYIPLPNALHSE